MNNQSRSAAREGFAHQRARLLLFAKLNIHPFGARAHNAQFKWQHDIVRDGLICFVPTGRS